MKHQTTCYPKRIFLWTQEVVMPRSKTRKKVLKKPKIKIEQSAQQHADWHVNPKSSNRSNYVPNMRNKQNANWERRG
ncbi:MAG: hypothetical protein JJ934_11140 [Pseudomonadales bacterium]|nr:hypothetical protein [Pseudomonadales bacterium]MBO6657443.1 hypothetical protein [Pseudomonadales bacterium]